ncbi:hypothetical protein Taro_027978 [Colocasia esculenta]|uniref:Uncharacterized protein n=1 Tax=Colocasia esculenta TaxID=4460 RepID=A0A843VQF4_COLES|nr:hypothetical protein [Colocasia esculenta]
MEGLIPFVYRAIVQYRNGGQPPVGSSWFEYESTSGVYMRLLGDSSRFQAQEIQLFNSSPSRGTYSAPAPAQSPLRRSSSRRHA